VLFLLRPRQTWMPYALPRDRVQVEERNREWQGAYDATRRVPRSTPAVEPARDPVADLKALADLHESGVLTDAEFAAAKAKVIGVDTGGR
jgi:hypothetical protein